MYSLYIAVCVLMPPETPIKKQLQWRTRCEIQRSETNAISRAACDHTLHEEMKRLQKWYLVFRGKCVERSDA